MVGQHRAPTDTEAPLMLLNINPGSSTLGEIVGSQLLQRLVLAF